MNPDDMDTRVYEINETINIPARLEITESGYEEDKPGQDYIDITVNVISTNVTGNGRQYTVEDLQLNSDRLNESGGLIFAMGKHPKEGEEPDASDHVGLGTTFVENDILTSKARIYNTAAHPDIVQNIKRRLVRDVSIEGFVRYYKKTCSGGKCWQRGIGLHILRATFVSSGADPAAKIIDIFESIDRNHSTEITMDKTETKPETDTAGDEQTSPPVNEQKDEQNTAELKEQETTGTGVNTSDTGESREETTPAAPDMSAEEPASTEKEKIKPVIETIDQDFKTRVLSALSVLEEIIAESRNPKEYTKSQIKNMLAYLKQNSGMADEEIRDVFYQCASKISDRDHVKHALNHLGENPGMVDDDMRSIMRQLIGAKESEPAPEDAKVEESEKMQATETGEDAGKRIVESPASPPENSTFTDEVRKHVR